MTYGIGDIIGDALTGNLLYASPETVENRKKVCRLCEHLIPPVIFNNTTGTCGKCGCFIDAKSTFQQSSCPLLKW